MKNGVERVALACCMVATELVLRSSVAEKHKLLHPRRDAAAVWDYHAKVGYIQAVIMGGHSEVDELKGVGRGGLRGYIDERRGILLLKRASIVVRKEGEW